MEEAEKIEIIDALFEYISSENTNGAVVISNIPVVLINIEHSSFISCASSLNGGAIYADSFVHLSMNNVLFFNCSSLEGSSFYGNSQMMPSNASISNIAIISTGANHHLSGSYIYYSGNLENTDFKNINFSRNFDSFGSFIQVIPNIFHHTVNFDHFYISNCSAFSIAMLHFECAVAITNSYFTEIEGFSNSANYIFHCNCLDLSFVNFSFFNSKSDYILLDVNGLVSQIYVTLDTCYIENWDKVIPSSPDFDLKIINKQNEVLHYDDLSLDIFTFEQNDHDPYAKKIKIIIISVAVPIGSITIIAIAFLIYKTMRLKKIEQNVQFKEEIMLDFG